MFIDSLYPSDSGIDGMMLETFWMNLEKKYDFDLSKVTNEYVILGKLFKMIKDKK
jgi:hypothetical protein